MLKDGRKRNPLSLRNQNARKMKRALATPYPAPPFSRPNWTWPASGCALLSWSHILQTKTQPPSYFSSCYSHCEPANIQGVHTYFSQVEPAYIMVYPILLSVSSLQTMMDQKYIMTGWSTTRAAGEWCGAFWSAVFFIHHGQCNETVFYHNRQFQFSRVMDQFGSDGSKSGLMDHKSIPGDSQSGVRKFPVVVE